MELSSSCNRVRDLIGESHWLSDGHHQEHLIQSVVARHLPSGMIATRGFVLDSSNEQRCSTEQDILIIDSTEEAPVFYEGGLAIVFPHSVRASVSVKSTLDKETLLDSVEGLHSVRELCKAQTRPIWTGAYFFRQKSKTKTLPYSHLNSLVPAGKSINMLCASPDLLYRTDEKDDGSMLVRGFTCGDLATGVFIAELIDHLAFSRGKLQSDITNLALAVGSDCQPINVD